MSYNVESFSFGIDEYGSELTQHSHQTLLWLNRNGYLSKEDTENLLSRMIVTPVRNRPRMGQRLLARFFGKDSAENSYVFPITLLEDACNPQDEKSDKPNLKLVK